MSKPQIKKIVIEVAGKRLEFTPDEAKELKQLLGDLFGEKQSVFVDRYPITYPRTYPYWPWATGYSYSGTSISGAYTATDQTLTLSCASQGCLSG